jgi:homeobox-leucine zipper protein
MESCFSSQNLDLHNMTSRRNSKTKRKFSDEQIKSLEIMFEAESRPEPRRKQQLANELGLQPHQASYDTLASSFESLEREHQSLLLQVHYNSKHK